MKKMVFLASAFLLTLSLFSQNEYEQESDFPSSPKNEVKINLPLIIFGSYPEISYERILNSDISVGASFGAGLDKDRYPMQLALTPYFRWFFGGNRKSMSKIGAGLFIEANGSLFSCDSEATVPGSNPEDKNSSLGAGLGVAVGWKYVSKNNWVGEIFSGVGRNFVENKSLLEVYPRVGISIGKRF